VIQGSFYEVAWLIYCKSNSLFGSDGNLVLYEVRSVLVADFDLCAAAVQDRGTLSPCTNDAGSSVYASGTDDRQAPGDA
jgi:hypothetical protein